MMLMMMKNKHLNRSCRRQHHRNHMNRKAFSSHHRIERRMLQRFPRISVLLQVTDQYQDDTILQVYSMLF